MIWRLVNPAAPKTIAWTARIAHGRTLLQHGRGRGNCVFNGERNLFTDAALEPGVEQLSPGDNWTMRCPE